MEDAKAKVVAAEIAVTSSVSHHLRCPWISQSANGKSHGSSWATKVNSVMVNTSNRFDVAKQQLGISSGRDPSVVMETLIDGWISNCVPPIATHGVVANDLHVSSWRESGHGLRGGEASDPGPSPAAPTQWDLTAGC